MANHGSCQLQRLTCEINTMTIEPAGQTMKGKENLHSHK